MEIFVFCILFLFGGSYAQIVSPGQCDNNIISNFDVSRFSDTLWHEIYRYPSELNQGTCATKELVSSATEWRLSTSHVADERLITRSELATVSNETDNVFISTTLPGEGNATVYLELHVLGTDYAEYALLYSCRNLPDNRKQIYSWQLSTSKNGFSASARNALDTLITQYDLEETSYQSVDQGRDGCFYYPDFTELPEAIELPGPCDDRITAIPSFNITAYLGRWFEIARYPTPVQGGECSRAEYGISGNVATVFNTEVVDQALETISGTATVAEDGSGLLSVTFVVNGVPITEELSVLATDYENYSLVYNCRNLPNGKRLVTSWKLSRARELNSESNTAINNVIANTQGLDEELYKSTSQSDEACFYIPELNENQPVDFPGQCENVTGVADFNITYFLGWWHEVESYPTGNEGYCRSSQYSGFGINLQAVDIIVNGLTADQVTYDVTATSDGQLIRVPVNGPAETWIVLATDYENYALLYNCENINEEYRRVRSTKLSKTATLTEESHNAMAPIIEANDVLRPEFYLNVDQSDEACFHYPPPDGKPVVLRGQCERNMPVVLDFKLDNFTGRWLELEKFPQEWDTRSCTSFLLRRNGNELNVIYREIFNGQLESIEGNARLLDSEDGGARFIIDIPSENNAGDDVSMYVYILATDYESYALAYSCSNINNFERQILSWKLGRTHELDDFAKSEINNTINNIDVLLEDYYVPNSHSVEACFHVPEPDETRPVFLVGPCEHVTGMQGFNLQQFAGWWHEVESYPTGSSGNCRSSRYTESANNYQVVDTVVQGNDYSSETFSVTATSNGRITRRHGSNEETWIVLGTDYQNYALLYYCENIENNTRRRVWSSKQSKTGILTEAAQNAMAPIIAANTALHPELFIKQDQSEEACFHYPTPDGGPVVLRGKCALDIPVVTDFQVDEFTGRWYQTERYPQEWETGNCSGVQFTVNDQEERVDVLQWQVIDGELQVTEINATVTESQDNGARFILTVPSNRPEDQGIGTISMYLYVLTSDYTSYSLVYNCIQVNDFERRVSAWKLSRTRTMPSSGNTAITQYMARRQELDQRYFTAVGQDEDCEEPSSGFFVKSSFMIIVVSSLSLMLLF